MIMLTERDVIERLQAAVQAVGSQKAFAVAHGISEQYVSDLLRGRRELSPKILDILGLERVVSYREKRSVK